MSESTQLAADRLVKVISKKHSHVPDFQLVMQYRNDATFFDLVPRPFDGMLELLGFIQDPRYQEINVPFRRWFTLAVIDEQKIASLY
jgi:hypothetical protein